MTLDNVIRYKELTGSRSQKKAQLNEQLIKFEKDAEAGKVLCLSDLIGNAESLIDTKEVK